MARLFTSGFELQSTTAGVELSSSGIIGDPNEGISTSIKRSGAASLRIAPVNHFSWAGHVFKAAVSSTRAFMRVYIYITTMPTGAGTQCEILSAWDSGAAARKAHIRLATTGALQLYNTAGTQIGSDSKTLSTGIWYMVELDVEAGTGVAKLTARLDGVVFATTTSTTVENFNACYLGAPNAASSFDICYDDWAINDSSGSFQNEFPGPGSIICLRPNAAGDNAAWARGGTDSGANWSQVEEIPPTGATDYVQSNTSGQIDDYNVGASGLSENDRINVVEVGGRFAVSNITGTDPTFRFRLKASASGTVEESADITASSATYGTNTVASANPMISPIVTYDLPGASTTKWNATDLDQAQIGINETLTDTHFARISAIWMMVEYVAFENRNPWPLRIANKFVGPMAMRFGFRFPFLPQFYSPGAAGSLTLNLDDTATSSDDNSKAIGLNKSDSVTPTDAISKAIGKPFSDSVTPSDAIVKSVGLNKSDSVTAIDANSKAVGKGLSDSATATDQISKAVFTTFADSATATDAKSLGVGKVAADSVTCSDNNSNGPGKALADSVTPTDAAVRSVTKALSDSATAADALVKSIFKVLSDSVTATDNLNAVTGLGLFLTDSVTASDAVAKSVSKTFDDTMTLLDSISTLIAQITIGQVSLVIHGAVVSAELDGLDNTQSVKGAITGQILRGANRSMTVRGQDDTIEIENEVT